MPRPSSPWRSPPPAGRGCPGPLASGPGQRIRTPPFQCRHRHSNLLGHPGNFRTLRREQSSHRPFSEFVAVSSQCRSSTPPRLQRYRGDNYGDKGDHGLGKSRPANRAELSAGVRSHLRRRQKQPQVIRNLLQENTSATLLEKSRAVYRPTQ